MSGLAIKLHRFGGLLGRGPAKKQLRDVARCSSTWVNLYGMYGSPYTRKVQAALRYKQVPFVMNQLMPGNLQGDWDDLGLSSIKPKVIPVIRYEDGSVQNDSTFILERLDKQWPTRPITPPDPVDRFLAILLEDLFDEWGTKVMFGMRWLEEVDQKWTATWLLYDGMMGKGTSLEQCEQLGEMFGARQVGRMHVVGCENPAMVHRSLHQLSSSLENHLAGGALCLLGQTPSIADFALYGQLSQLVVDRTPDELIRDRYPAVWAWVRRFEDLSGLESAHHDNEQYLKDILTFAGEVYLPFLAANSQALMAGEDEVTVDLWTEDPITHTQPVFRYQAKCLARLRDNYQALSPSCRERAEQLLQESKCLQYLQ